MSCKVLCTGLLPAPASSIPDALVLRCVLQTPVAGCDLDFITLLLLLLARRFEYHHKTVAV